MEKNGFELLWKGMVVGGTMIVPGVSGGTMAMILGIYDQLISNVSSWRKSPVRNSLKLVQFVIGAGIGIFCFVTPLSWLLERYRLSVMYFFIGAVLGGVPLIERKSKIQGVSWREAGYMVLGIIIVFLISAIPTGTLGIQGNFLSLLIVGSITAVALILPGISISHVFLILGIYEKLLQAIQELDFSFLIPLALGVLLGIGLCCKLLEYVMNRFPGQTYLIILGFILGSVAEIFPGVPTGASILVCIGLFVLGFTLLYSLGKSAMDF